MADQETAKHSSDKYLPEEPQWLRRMRRKHDLQDSTRQTCGAKTNKGRPCTRDAGWGTDHPGSGHCKFHGGANQGPKLASPILTSYLDPALSPYIERMLMEEEDLLNCRFELAVLKGYFRVLQERDGIGEGLGDDGDKNEDEKDKDEKDVTRRAKALSTLARTIMSVTERIQQMETGRHHYLHITVTGTLIQAFAEIGRRYIPDPRQRELFTKDLEQSIRKSLPRAGARTVAARALNPYDEGMIIDGMTREIPAEENKGDTL